MLDDPKLEDVLQLNDHQRTILLDCLKELEFGETQQWGVLQEASTEYLRKDELDLVWLRKVAVSLFHELHCTFPWSIFQYSYDELVSLLLLHPANYNWDVGPANDYMLGPNNPGRDYAYVSAWWESGDKIYWPNLVWNANPLDTDKIRADLSKASPLGSHADVVAAVLGYCCTKWFEPACLGTPPAASTHVIDTGGWNDPDHFARSYNVDWVWANRFGGCNVLSYLLRHVFTAFNIPCVNGCFPTMSTWGHWGVYLPVTEQVVPHVDWFIHACSFHDSECAIYSGSHNMPYHEYAYSLDKLKELGVYSDPSLTYFKLRNITFLRGISYFQDPVLAPKYSCLFAMYLAELDLAWGAGSKWQWLIQDKWTMYGSFAPAPLSDPSFAIPFWEWFMVSLYKYIADELAFPSDLGSPS